MRGSEDGTMTQPNSWRRFVAEGVVIVASILLAFGIDAWWADVQDQKEAELILRALGTEFRENLAELRAVHDVHVRYAQELGGLVGLMASQPDGSILQVADSELRPLISFRTADPATGTLSTLLASGRIDLIRNEELQQALAGWPAVVEDVAEDERLVRDFVHGQLVTGIVNELDVGQLLVNWSDLGPGGATTRVSDVDQLSLRVSPTSRAMIGERYHLAQLVVSQSGDRLEAGDAILSMIDRAIASR
jgi:hypothetical protein